MVCNYLTLESTVKMLLFKCKHSVFLKMESLTLPTISLLSTNRDLSKQRLVQKQKKSWDKSSIQSCSEATIYLRLHLFSELIIKACTEISVSTGQAKKILPKSICNTLI